MIVYFAGNLAQKERIRRCLARYDKRLLSFYFLKFKLFLVDWEFNVIKRRKKNERSE